MLTTALKVYEQPEGAPTPGYRLIDGATDGGGRFQVWASRETLYLVRAGLPTRVVVLDDLLAAMVRAEHAPDPKGGR